MNIQRRPSADLENSMFISLPSSTPPENCRYLGFPSLLALPQLRRPVSSTWIAPFCITRAQKLSSRSKGTCRAHLICPSPPFIVTVFHCLKVHVKRTNISYILSLFSCFRQEGKSSPYYSILAKRSDAIVILTDINMFFAQRRRITNITMFLTTFNKFEDVSDYLSKYLTKIICALCKRH